MDIILDASISAKKQEGSITQASEFHREFVQLNTKEMRDGLVDVGRPLWQRYKVANAKNEQTISRDCWEGSRNDEWQQLFRLAAQKLVGIQHLSNVAKGDSLDVVAALLCRVGVRPYSWPSLASRMVADYMAILVHMSFTHDQLVCTYSTDPISTFGAAKVWYEKAQVEIGDRYTHVTRPLLEHRMLPELRTMLHQEVLDTGGIGELVARIVLLLAMDATGIVTTGQEAQRCYDGELYSVSTFLKALSGESSKVKCAEGLTVDDLLQPWEQWNVGFSHFVQLSVEPSDEAL